MKDLRPSKELSDSDEEPQAKEPKPKLPFPPQKPLLRTNSAGQHILADRKMASARSTPKLYRPQTSYEKDRHSLKSMNILHEAKDKLTHLPINDSPSNLKSILKNRKHSFDDLDVSTKKGLALYLKSKQKESHHLTNVHFH